jgi:catechol 2,3-dioxygenase-like lactoylglutathione lyase family enzyme
MEIIGVHHTGLTVSDLKRSLDFYHGILGFPIVMEKELMGTEAETIIALPGTHIRLAHVKAGEHQTIELLQYLAPQGLSLDKRTCNVGNGHICFVVSDIQKTYQELKAKGVYFKSEPVRLSSGKSKGGYAVYFTDPDGITLELFQRPPSMAI